MERVVVIGPGAIGLLVAGGLARAGMSVALLDHRPERARKLATEGFTIMEQDGETRSYTIPCSTDPGALAPADCALLAVKAHDTPGAFPAALELLGPSGVLVSLQNGLRHVDVIRSYLPAERTVFGTTGHGATRVDAARVRHCGSGATLVAAESGNAAPAGEAAALLSRAGLAARVVEDLSATLWRKLMFNAAINPLTAIVGVRNGALPRIAPAWQLALDCFRETREIAALAAGPALAQVEDEELAAVCAATADNLSSMLQDLRYGRRTEIHEINGVVAEEARRRGRDAPVNRMLESIVSALEEARR